jgi:hypothetical protein
MTDGEFDGYSSDARGTVKILRISHKRAEGIRSLKLSQLARFRLPAS